MHVYRSAGTRKACPFPAVPIALLSVQLRVYFGTAINLSVNSKSIFLSNWILFGGIVMYINNSLKRILF